MDRPSFIDGWDIENEARSDVIRILSAIEQGAQRASEQLLRKSQVRYLDLTYDTDKSLNVTMAFEVEVRC